MLFRLLQQYVPTFNGNQPPLNNNFAPPFAWQHNAQMAAQSWQLNHELLKKDSVLMQYKTNAQKYGYESKIRQLNQEIQLLKSSDSHLGKKCAELNNELLKKDSELEVLKINAQKYGYESKIRGLNQEICHLKSSEQQKLFCLREDCAKLNDELLKKNTELDALKVSEAKYNAACDNLEGLLLKNFKAMKQSKERMESEIKAKANEIAKLNETMAAVKRDYDGLMSDFSSQISKLNDKNKKLEISIDRSAKLEIKVKAIEDKCKEYIAEIKKLKQDSANSRQLELAKVEELTVRNEKLADECKRVSKLYNESFAMLHLKLESNLNACRTQVQKVQDDMSRVAEERDRLKMELKLANENSETAMERITKLQLKLKIQEEQYTTEIENLQKHSADPQTSTIECIIRILAKPTDAYEVLQVPQNASAASIKKKYRELSLRFHPDKCKIFGSDEAFKAVAAAYKLLNSRFG
ncbi:dnaJ domain-containing protein [Ditylenchus destructor]|nr:dnaJ domain-containing protein [Ditylenchus destructor]